MKAGTRIVETFKAVLKDASKMFGVPEHSVGLHHFEHVNRRRISQNFLRILGFKRLREYVAPSPKGSDEASRKAMQQLLKSIGGSK